MSEEKEYTLQEGEDYMDFLYRALQGQASDDRIQLLAILLEIVITELQGYSFTLSLVPKPQEIDMIITHNGHAIKDSIMQIIDNQVSYLRYQHPAKDRHVLKLCKEK